MYTIYVFFEIMRVLSTIYKKFRNYYNFFYKLIREFKNKKFKTIIINFLTKNVFYSIKNAMCNNRVLIQFNIFLFFIIEIDAFDFDWKAILYQKKFNNKKRFITFENKAFSFVEKNYVIYKREFLIIKKSFRK